MDKEDCKKIVEVVKIVVVKVNGHRNVDEIVDVTRRLVETEVCKHWHKKVLNVSVIEVEKVN